jgi:hypothetical protein
MAASTSRVVPFSSRSADLGTRLASARIEARPVGSYPFQHLAHGEQEHHERRLLGRADEQRACGGDRHQHLDGEGQAHAERGEGAPRHGRHAHEAGQDERPAAHLGGGEQLDAPGCGQEEPCDDYQPALGRAMPGLVAVGGVSLVAQVRVHVHLRQVVRARAGGRPGLAAGIERRAGARLGRGGAPLALAR